MDTKWKKFSRSRGIKVLLAVLYIICFGAAGIIWGYTPAYSYIRLSHQTYGMDSLLADDFDSSEYFTDKLLSDASNARYCYLGNAPEGTLPKEVGNLPFPCVIYKNGFVVTNIDGLTGLSEEELAALGDGVGLSAETADEIISDIGGILAYYIRIDKDGVTTLTSGRAASAVGYFASALDIGDNNDYIVMGYTDEKYTSMRNYWYQMRHNMTVVVISELCLIVMGIVLLILSCIVAGESADGSVSLKNAFRLPYEITLLALVLSAILSVHLLFGYIRDLDSFCSSFNSRALYMVFCGLAAALSAMLGWYLCVSFSVRRKNKRALKGSLLYYVFGFVWVVLKKLFALLKYIGKALLRLLVFIKELFTGEAYKGTAAKKTMIIDIVSFGVSGFFMVFGLLAVNDHAHELGALFIALGFAVVLAALFGKYLILRDGAKLENQIRRMYGGSFANPLQTMAKNSPYAASSEMLSEMSEQYRRGIEESVKAERMKMELVTNVSHDLKTPLTSIIGYIELLSKEDLPPEAEEHVRILQSKSERLKNIVSDVFELAKTTSGEITVEREPLDLTKLSYQTLAEMEDKIVSAGFDIKVNICEPPVTVVSDGKRLYRIIQNLLDNALKYSLKGTRIYYSLDVREDRRAYIVIKNIAAYEMTFTKEEILERFTRGDKARSSEGSGLGLSIAQGFTLACGGRFDIDIDGDMFKSIVSFPVASVNAAEQRTAVMTDG